MTGSSGRRIEVGGDVSGAALELPLVEEAESGDEESDDGRGAVDVVGEGGGGAGLVVVLQEAGGATLILGIGPEVAVGRPRRHATRRRSYSRLS